MNSPINYSYYRTDSLDTEKKLLTLPKCGMLTSWQMNLRKST